MSEQRVKILIIDDDPADRAIFKEYIETSGSAYVFREEATGVSGLRACEEFNPDCVLLDYSLPDIDGLAILRQLNSGERRYPVVMLTAIGSEQIAVEAMKLGLMDYLAKNPDSMNHLPRTIENAIQRFRMERQIIIQRRELEERNRELEIAQSSLLEEKEKYLRLTEAIPQLVWSASSGHLIQYANRRLLEYGGQRANSSWPFTAIVDPRDVNALEEVWQAATACGGVLETEVRLKRASDGASRWHLIRAVPVYGSEGKLINWFGTCTDIEDQKQTEETVRQQQKLESIGLLAGGIAHDFNNLLVGIMGGASFALQTLEDDHAAYPILNVVLRSSERAAHLTQQLLAYAGKGQMFAEPVNISHLLQETCTLINASISKSVDLNLKIDHDIPLIDANPSQIQQLMMNLIINASEAIGEGRGTVTVRTFTRHVEDTSRASRDCGYALVPGQFVGFEVTDSGCGMDEATAARIFEPFFTTKFTGRGLGLAAAQGIVRSLRGWIEVKSSPGKGSRFRVMLPAKEQHRQAREKSDAPTVAERLGRGQILVIDDEDLVRRTATAILERAGYSVLTARSGADGLDILRDRPEGIDLVVLDLSMPGKSGVEVFHDIRELNCRVPVAISSGYSEEEVIKRFDSNTIAGFVQKPFTSSRLVEDVANLLKPRTASGSAS